MIKIIGSVVSPYTRMVRVMCEELALQYDFEIIPSFKDMNEQEDLQLKRSNPLFRIPILIDSGNEIIESRIILSYLVENYALSDRAISNFSMNQQRTNLTSVLYGIIDSAILTFMLQSTNPEINSDIGYIKRAFNRIESGLQWIDDCELFAAEFGIPEIVMICGLDWFSKRDIYDWRKYSNISQVYDVYSSRPSLMKTSIPISI